MVPLVRPSGLQRGRRPEQVLTPARGVFRWFQVAEALHGDFYEDEMEPADIGDSLDDVERLLDKLEPLVGLVGCHQPPLGRYHCSGSVGPAVKVPSATLRNGLWANQIEIDPLTPPNRVDLCIAVARWFGLALGPPVRGWR